MSEIINFFQNLCTFYGKHELTNVISTVLCRLVVENSCNLRIFCNYICVHSFNRPTDTILLRQLSDNYMFENRVPVNSRWLYLLGTSTSTSNTISCLSCVHYTIFPVVKLDKRALLLDHNLALEKLYEYILFSELAHPIVCNKKQIYITMFHQ